jgi:hypothetical protein
MFKIFTSLITKLVNKLFPKKVKKVKKVKKAKESGFVLNIRSTRINNHKNLKTPLPLLKGLSPSSKLNETKIPLEDWDDPRPLTKALLPVPELSKSMVPESIYLFCVHEARRLDGSAPEYVLVSCIVSAAALIGGTSVIMPKEKDKAWEVWQNFFGLIVGAPSKLKTPATNQGKSLLDYAQKTVIDPFNIESKKLYEEWLENPENQKLDDENTESKVMAFENIEDEELVVANVEVLVIKPTIPLQRNVVVNDLTPEALLIRLQSNPFGVMMFRDEIYAWLSKMERDDSSQERSIYTEAFNGNSSYVQERVSRAAVSLERLSVSILGCIQPDRLLPLIRNRNSGLSNDGFFERFQLLVFSEKIGKYTDITQDQELLSRLRKVFCCLAKLGERDETLRLNFNIEAQGKWNDWAKKHKEDLETEAPQMQAVLGKYPALVARLSMVFHLINCADTTDDYTTFAPSDSVNIHSLHEAIKFSELLIAHNARIQEYANDEENAMIGDCLLNSISKLQRVFSVRELQRKGWTGLKSSENCQKSINILLDHGYLRKCNDTGANGQPMVRYEIHPDY